MDQSDVLLNAQDLKKYYVTPQPFVDRIRSIPLRKEKNSKPGSRVVRAVDGVSLTIQPGEIVGLVGESGSGKTTLARLLLRLISLTEGRIWFNGEEITKLNRTQMRQHRRLIRLMFQSPAAALNPLLTIGEILAEAINTHTDLPKVEWESEAKELLGQVKLSPNLEQYSGDLSTGQQRRVSIARTLVGNAKLIVADEPVAALDVSIRAQIINLLKDINQEREVAYLLISHDLSMIRYMSDRILVMYRGRIVENGGRDEISKEARHPYTQELLRSADYSLALFHIDSRYKMALDCENLEPLRAEFEKQGILLSPETVIEKKGQTSWLITGDTHAYRLLQEGNQLEIYASHVEQADEETVATGCLYRSRCLLYQSLSDSVEKQVCETDAPDLRIVSDSHRVACHHG